MPIADHFRFRYVLLGLDWLIPPLRRRLLRQYEASLLLDLTMPDDLEKIIRSSEHGYSGDALMHEMMLDQLETYRAVRELRVPVDLFGVFVMGHPWRVHRAYSEEAYGRAYWNRPEDSYPWSGSYPWRRLAWRFYESKRREYMRERSKE